ncbi:MAG: hypothetical protein QOI22_776 [Verrucomicrobiota bacterium]|jgi:hypothetical protein
MPSSPTEPVDLLDLKLLPAWMKESTDGKQYEHYQGEEGEGRGRGGRDHDRGFRKPKSSRTFEKKRDGDRASHPGRPQNRGRDRKAQPRQGRPSPDRPRQDRQVTFPPKPIEIEIRFVPHPPALENVAAQIKSSSVAYSLFALARLFLEKPERYDVRLKTKPESPLFQLGENGALSTSREFLERDAFRFAQGDFYKIDITESEPIKGNFTNVARCNLSGTLLGPTNHHSYQARLRNLYEQRFSRRMSFADYQRQIEIISDPAAVEQWKEEARKITTLTALREEPPLTFASAAEAERHFRKEHLTGLLRNVEEAAIDGVSSRRLPDRALQRTVEDAWVRESRSPSQMMQELAARLREGGLHIFRHRKGMLFVSSIRVRPFARDGVAFSPTVSAILETLSASPRINRKDLAEKVDLSGEEGEARKLALASDLHWLISEGYVIEFNDGSLDLPREKRPKPEKTQEPADAAVSRTEPKEQTVIAANGPLGSPSADESPA